MYRIFTMDLRTLLLLSSIYILVLAQDDPHRLPTNVKPSRYTIDLTLTANFYISKTFTGTVTIEVEVTSPTNTIILNSANITYPAGSVIITKEESADPIPVVVDYDEEHQQITLTTNDDLGGNYVLRFENYVGLLHEDMYGFYLSYYTDDDGSTQYIATTQFQPTHARRAFPSFDEPNFKAVFIVSITRPEGYHSLGNTKSSTVDTKDQFAPTPSMSTYLLAFIVSKFKGYGRENFENIEQYDVWCRESALPTAEYAYTVGPKMLEKLDEFTGIEYYSMENVEKMDQIAIPDFAAGAMENWGLVTYRETALLWHNTEATASYKQRVAAVIAHEFTHMWFGNLVTMDWWSYTWLNEGFARYYQYVITNEVEDKWELLKQFVIDQQQVIFAADALESSAALNSDASTPSQISNKFASTSYNKGASVIRMMVNFMGEESYREGIRQYLKDNQYSNTVPSHLYTALSDAWDEDQLPEGVSLSDVMSTWTTQAGYPVVTVSRDSSGFRLTQERFLLNSAATSTFKWHIPITYTTEESPDFDNTTVSHWLLKDNDLVIEHEGSEGWVVVNLQETGYYRVNYDDALWDELERALVNDSAAGFPDLNRAQIVDDVMNLARANKLTYSRALSITTFLRNDDSYYPWTSAFNAFSFLRRRIDSSSYVGETLQKHILNLMDKLRVSVDFSPNPNDHVGTLKTALTLQWACDLGEPTCLQEANELFDDYVSGTSINPNVRSVVYCSAVRNPEIDNAWDFLWQKYGETQLATEQVTILTALGCSRDETILKDYLQKSIDETSGIRKQDANTVFSAVLSGNPGNVDIAFEFLSENVEAVVNYYEGMNALTSIINGIADRLTTEEQIDKFEEFIEENSAILKDAAVTGATAVETARANLQWAESNHDELNDWLYDTYGSAASITLSFTVILAAVVVFLFNQ